MSNRKATPDQVAFILKFKNKYFSYFGPEKRKTWAAKVLIAAGITISLRQVYKYWVRKIKVPPKFPKVHQ